MTSFQFKDNSGKAIQTMDQKVEKALTAMGMQAENYAKLNLENYPRRIDTGLLRNSVTFSLGGEATNISTYTDDKKQQTGNYSGSIGYQGEQAVYIGTNVEYAPYVHEGTDRMIPNRFIRNAVAEHAKEYIEIASRMLKNG